MSAQILPPSLPLDPSIYNLKEDEKAFFKSCTGIRDDDELQKHVTQVQTEAYAVHPYPCIRRFAFTSLKVSKHPAYQKILQMGRERPGAILLDLACCFGNDARKAVADGFPCENVIASDLRPEYWMLGHKLFMTAPETFPMTFLAGDVFDPAFLSPMGSPASTSTTPPASAPVLPKLTSLTPLQHHISVILTLSFFHLFSESQQFKLAHLLGSLLSPLPGSMILGSHMCIPDTEVEPEGRAIRNGHGIQSFAHSPASWERMWVGEGGVFRPEVVDLSTKAIEVKRKDVSQSGGNIRHKAYLLVWTVTRV